MSEWVLSYPEDPRSLTQVFRLGGKLLSVLSHLDNLSTLFLSF